MTLFVIGPRQSGKTQTIVDWFFQDPLKRFVLVLDKNRQIYLRRRLQHNCLRRLIDGGFNYGDYDIVNYSCNTHVITVDEIINVLVTMPMRDHEFAIDDVEDVLFYLLRGRIFHHQLSMMTAEGRVAIGLVPKPSGTVVDGEVVPTIREIES